MKTKTLKSTVLLFLSFSIPALTFAQDLPPGDTVDTPIDSWLFVLLGIGVLYGILKIRSKRNLEGQRIEEQSTRTEQNHYTINHISKKAA